MEDKGLLQSKELYQYVLETSVYPGEAEPLKELREATAKHPRAQMATAPDSGQLMAFLLKLINPKKTIEIGVFTGHSFLLTALSIPEDGKPENEGTFHFAYVDADKNNNQYYHERLLKLLRVGGIIVYDNTLWGGMVVVSDESLVPERYKSNWCPMIEFNKFLVADSRIQLAQVSVGDGTTICVRLY
ncbi:O-methyltransferase [Macleaya cordata]|uniref:O-methyltransferase n=1 Tax=Macleaya cordata TaxID=56857 RepID=A0A200QMV1_MACCD|nr:O-methyltransferase [Macleaya cordata]